MKIPILSGNVSNRETIEPSTVSARTGNLASSVRTIPITYVQFFVPEKYLEIPWYHQKTGEWTCGFPSETPRLLALNVSASRVRDFCVNPHVGIQFFSVGSVGGLEIEGVANGCEGVRRTAATSAVDVLDHHRA